MQKPAASLFKYDFIDTLRFISMIAIVMEHASLVADKTYTSLNAQLVQITSIHLFKYGTIIFFLLSGFLIGDKFEMYSSREYFKRRWANTFKPWLFWVIIAITLNYINLVVVYVKFGMMDLFKDPWNSFVTQVYDVVFLTSFWFIINFLICIAILLSFRKYINSMVFGSILAALSLFYSINLYHNWIPPGHTIALFGFVFYLWLGYQLNRYFVQFKQWLDKTSIWYLVSAFVLTYILACTESLYMLHRHLDAFNTLKITTIIFSLATFVMLFKLSSHINVQRFKPRMVTYGIYLLHSIIIFHLLPEIFRPMGFRDEDYRPMWQMMSLTLIRFIITYSLSYGLSLLIAKAPKKISWLVGQ